MGAMNFPSNPTSGQQYTDDNGIVWEYISSKTVWEVLRDDKLKDFYGAKATLTTAVALTSTSTAVTFDTEVFDIGSYYNLAQPTRLTVTNPGFYRINLLVVVSNLGSGASYTFAVKKNGSTNLTSTPAGPNQSVSYDEIVQLLAGDYIELYASESDNIGEISPGSFFEIENVGDPVGSAQSPATAFSGLKLDLSTTQALTSSLAPIAWSSADFNTNADINGNVYWNISSASKATIYTTGYYRIKAFIQAGTQGSDSSYQIQLRFDNSPVVSSSLSPNDSLDLDDMYNLTSASYIQFFASESGNIGEIATGSFFELIRLGV